MLKVYIRDDHGLHSAIEDLVCSGKDIFIFEVRISGMSLENSLQLWDTDLE